MNESFDISALQPIKVANPRFDDGYQLRRKNVKNGPFFQFSPQLASRINLSVNSLGHADGKPGTPQEGKVYISVHPGNGGSWAKNPEGGRKKGRQWKNANLATSLDAIGMTTTELDLKHVATVNGVDYYQVIPYEDASESEQTAHTVEASGSESSGDF